MNPPSRKRNAWSYIDARDLGQIVDLAIGIEDLARDFHARVIINLSKRPNHVVAAQRERGDAI